MTVDKHPGPVIFGEVLFDCFPDGNSVLGGAPFNVAWHLQAFGLAPLVISGVGDDELGENVRRAMLDWNMNTAGLQIDSAHPTGSVDIEFDDGEPRYTIVENRAYDNISAGSLPATAEDSLLYHGSLALRNEVSRQALATLKADHGGTVFMDVNLRDPWWQRAFVLELASDADWVKLNEDELHQLGSNKGSTEAQAGEFMKDHALTGLVVTLGARGAVAFTADGLQAGAAPSQALEVVDTVGAGDAFTSVLILGIMHQWPLDLTMQRAQDFAALIVGKQGATVHDPGFYRTITHDWQLDV